MLTVVLYQKRNWRGLLRWRVRMVGANNEKLFDDYNNFADADAIVRKVFASSTPVRLVTVRDDAVTGPERLR